MFSLKYSSLTCSLCCCCPADPHGKGLVDILPHRQQKLRDITGAILHYMEVVTAQEPGISAYRRYQRTNEVVNKYYRMRRLAGEGEETAAADCLLQLIRYYLDEQVAAGWTLETRVIQEALRQAGWKKQPSALVASRVVCKYYKN
jgi:hypothetical protein